MDTTSDTTAASMVVDVEPNNVLFEPEIYRPVIDEAMQEDDEDKHSVSTHAGGVNMSMVSNYRTDLDPSLFAANRM